MTDAWRTIKIRQFEHVIAGPTTSLLRVSGKPPRRRDRSQRPTLLADDGSHVHRFAAIPSPADPRGVLRAAYSVPTDVMTADSVFSLELSDGYVIALPAPTPGPGRPASGGSNRAPEPAAVPRPDSVHASGVRAPGHSAHERRAATIDQLAELSAALGQAEQASGEHDAARVAAEAELDQSRVELAALERRIAELEAEAGEAAQRLSAARAQAGAAAEETSAARELSGALERRNGELETSVRELQEKLPSLERDRATAVAARSELEGEIAAVRRARARSEQELEQAQDAVRIMTFERDELSRQVAAFDDLAVKARERTSQAEAASERSASALDELQTWRGELERRLTATTTELGVAKAARQEDEHELKRLRGELSESEAKFDLARAEIESLNEKLAAHATAEAPPPVADQSDELERMAIELEALRAAQAIPSAAEQPNGDLLERLQMLESERDEIAKRAQQLAALLAPVQNLGEIAQGLAQARSEAESLQAAIAVELRPSAVAAGTTEGGSDDATAPLSGARAEIHALRGQLEEARSAAADAQMELIGHAAEAQARQQAERELADAAGPGRRSGR